MSIYAMMRTGMSGMSAQATRLAATADNIANSATAGYKRVSASSSSLPVPATPGLHVSGAVKTNIHHAVSQQGALRFDASATDLAISGEGFFVVEDKAGDTFLTRSGTFVPDGEGRLVNAAGFYLMGYEFEGDDPADLANGHEGPEIVSIPGFGTSPEAPDRIHIDGNGIVTALHKDGTKEALYRIPLATVAGPDHLAVHSGNVLAPTAQSGDMAIGFPQTGSFGAVLSGALESSNVDLSQELTNTIMAGNAYAANLRVLETGSELLDILLDLKR